MHAHAAVCSKAALVLYVVLTKHIATGRTSRLGARQDTLWTESTLCHQEGGRVGQLQVSASLPPLEGCKSIRLSPWHATKPASPQANPCCPNRRPQQKQGWVLSFTLLQAAWGGARALGEDICPTQLTGRDSKGQRGGRFLEIRFQPAWMPKPSFALLSCQSGQLLSRSGV